jgi:hypothetical protein
MSNLAQVLSQLRSVRTQLQAELAKVEGAIGALNRISPGRGRRAGNGRRRRNRLSPAARARIAAAQRARWAKVRQQKQKQQT